MLVALVWLVLQTSMIGANSTVCVRPTEPPDVHCHCLTIKHCHTLCEWIEDGKTNSKNVTVLLLAGMHFFNSTKERQLENLVALTGERGQTTVICLHNKLQFTSGQLLKVSRITFHNCTIVFLYIQHVIIDDIIVTDGRVVVNNQILFHPSPFNNQHENDLKSRCENQERVDVRDSCFQNATILVQGSTDVLIDDYLYTSCVEIDIQRILIESVGRKNKHGALSISHAYSVTFRDIVVQNNSTPLLHLFVTNFVTFKGHCSFSWNNGSGSGVNISKMGSLTINGGTEITLIGNNVHAGCLLYVHQSLYDKTSFDNSLLLFEYNEAHSGGIMVIEDVRMEMNKLKLIFKNNTSLMSDTSSSQSFIILLFQTSDVLLYNSELVFVGNSALLSGGITLFASNCRTRNITAVFEFNEGGNGGALAFYGGSHVLIESTDWYWEGSLQTNVQFCSNRAHKMGGAIFVDDSDYTDVLTTQYEHFIQSRSTVYREPTNILVKFNNNIAEIAGDDIYGGWIDSNMVVTLQLNVSGHFPKMNSMYAVTSNPVRICICVNSLPHCDVTEYQTEVYPGQAFKIDAVAVGQRMGIVPSIVSVSFTDKEGHLGEGQDVQSVGKQCTTLKFTVHTSKKRKVLNLNVRNSAIPNFNDTCPLLYQEVLFTIQVNDCPLGYAFNPELLTCQCLPQIKQHGIECNFTNFTISRSKQQWLSPTTEHVISQQYGVIVHDQCPYDYCRTDADSLSFHLEFPDDQCAFSRSGVLCGGCEHKLSQTLGTSQCMDCSNIMLLAVIPAFFIAGVLLVAFLMLFNLTVSVGTINGLIFYANIVRASQAIFFSPQFNTSFLSTFIAWLNLDLGIETCFYNGLDAYAKTWLQFVFPLYIWLMVITIIVSSHYSTIISWMTPNNALQVLATLFLLSYAKILRVSITVFSSTLLWYPDNFRKRVWLYDGNIEFLKGRHIPLFIATLLLIIPLSFPYTLSLVSIQWLQRISHYNLLSWVHRLMPLFDAYTGPYKHKHRYWTGMLLVVRVIVLTIFSLNQINSPAINLLAIVVIVLFLLAYLSYVGGVYKSWVYNILEIYSILNLGILSAVTLYQLFNGNNAVLISTISTSFAFAIFIIITVCHAIQQLLLSRKVQGVKSQLTALAAYIVRIQRGRRGGQVENMADASSGNEEITHTSIELCEPLIS